MHPSLSKVIRFAGIGLVAVYFGILVWYGARTFSNVPLADDYAVIQTVADFEVQSSSERRPGLVGYMFRRHNEHLCVASRITFLVAKRFLQFDFAWMRWINMTLMVCVGALAFGFTRRIARGRDKPALYTSLPPALAFLIAASLGQWELLHTTMCIANLASVALSLIALTAVGRFLVSSRPGWLAWAVLCTLLSYWNLAAGAITALAATAMLAAFGRPRRIPLVLGLGIYSMALLWLQRQAGTGSPFSWSHVFGYVEGMASILGLAVLAISDSPTLEPVTRGFGYLILMLAVAVGVMILRHARSPRESARDEGMAVAFGLILLGVVSSGVIAFARFDGGLSRLMASRYYPFAMFVSLGLLLAAVEVHARSTHRFRGIPVIALILLLGIGQTTSSWIEMKNGWRRQQAGAAMIAGLRQYRSLSDRQLTKLAYVGSDHAGELRNVLGYLEANEMSFFAESSR